MKFESQALEMQHGETLTIPSTLTDDNGIEHAVNYVYTKQWARDTEFAEACEEDETLIKETVYLAATGEKIPGIGHRMVYSAES